MPIRLAAVLALGLLAGSARAQAVASVDEARFRVGDDPRWARPGWDDGAWDARSIYAPPDTQGVLWGRFEVSVAPGASPLGVAVLAVAAREVYWDGVLLGRSGRVGVGWASEVPGPSDSVHAVPDSLATPGRHTVALRMSTFRRPASVRSYIHGVAVGDLVALSADLTRGDLLPLVFLGGFVLVALYYGVLYAVVRRRTPYLLVSLLCLVVAALLGAESWRWIVGYPYDFHLTRLLVVTGLTSAVGVLLPSLFLAQFQVPHRGAVWGLLAVGIGLALFSPGGYDTKALAVFWVSLPIALGVTAWAAVRRRPGAGFALAGVAVCLGALALTGYRFMDTAFFPAFGVLVAGLLASLGLQTREQQRHYDAARAEAARLEAELLKTHLQPHFLMNTLTSVMEWIETEPATGIRFLEALADELRTLAEVSGERLVPMARELALCRSHLDVMSYRREVGFELDADGVDPEAPIPPATLHTLVENAITHNAYGPGIVRFRLREEREGEWRRYTLTTPLVGDPPDAVEEGGGLRYVRARLEESVPGRWALASSVKDGAWVTRIGLPA